MNEQSERLLKDGEILVADIDSLDDAAARLRERVAALKDQLLEDREAIASEAASLQQELETLREEADQHALRLADLASTLAAEVQAAVNELDAAAQDIAAALDETRTTFEGESGRVESARSAFAQQQEAHVASADQQNTAVLQAHEDTRGRYEASERRIAESTEHASATQSRLATIAEEFGTATGEQQQQLASSTEEEVFRKSEEIVRELVEKLKQLTDEVMRARTEAHQEELGDALNTHVQDVLHELLDRVTQTLESVSKRIAGGCDGNRECRNAMAPVREALDDLVEPIKTVLENVKHIAGIVGFHA